MQQVVITSTNSEDVASPTFLAQAPRMDLNEFENIELTSQDIGTISLFEDKWYEFLMKYPQSIPTGKRGKQINELYEEINKIEKNKNTVEKELTKQLEFFELSKSKLETNYKQSMGNAAQIQRNLHDHLQKRLDNVAMADQCMKYSVPWEYFLDTLDKVVTDSNNNSAVIKNTPTTPIGNSKQIKPSERAMWLAEQYDIRPYPRISIEDPKDLELRAYRIDHSLLSAQVKALQKEVQRHEKTTESLEIIGKFLTEHNIWGLLPKSSGLTTATTLTSPTSAAAAGLASPTAAATAFPMSP